MLTLSLPTPDTILKAHKQKKSSRTHSKDKQPKSPQNPMLGSGMGLLSATDSFYIKSALRVRKKKKRPIVKKVIEEYKIVNSAHDTNENKPGPLNATQGENEER